MLKYFKGENFCGSWINTFFIWPPGAGKGTQSKYLVNKLNAFQISTGDLLREEIKKNSDIGKAITNDMRNGKFISDDIVNKLIENLKKWVLKKRKKTNQRKWYLKKKTKH